VAGLERSLVKLQGDLLALPPSAPLAIDGADGHHDTEQMDGSTSSCCGNREAVCYCQVRVGSTSIYYRHVVRGGGDGEPCPNCGKRRVPGLDRVYSSRHGDGRYLGRHHGDARHRGDGVHISSTRTRFIRLDGEGEEQDSGEEVSEERFLTVEEVTMEETMGRIGEDVETPDDEDKDENVSAGNTQREDSPRSVVTNPNLYFDRPNIDGMSELSESDDSEFGEGEHLKFPSSPALPDADRFPFSVPEPRSHKSESDVTVKGL
jgi:hypothetical protein